MLTNVHTTMKKFLCIICVFLPLAMMAQTSDLTPEIEKQLTQQAKIQVDHFNQYVSFIASKQYSDEVRGEYAEAALDLFIGKGREYSDIYGNIKEAPQMAVSNVRTGVKRKYSVALYLQNLQYLDYSEIKMEFAKAVFISSLKQVSEDRYETVLSYCQIFTGYKDGIKVYSDKTTKQIKVYINRIGDKERSHWEVLLGDVDVVATEAY